MNVYYVDLSPRVSDRGVRDQLWPWEAKLLHGVSSDWRLSRDNVAIALVSSRLDAGIMSGVPGLS